MGLAEQRFKFTIDNYYKLLEIGILTKEDRVELIEGEIYLMPPITPRHASVRIRLTNLLLRLVLDSIVSVPSPIRVSEMTELQPDLSVLQFRQDYYKFAHPLPHEVLLIIEAAGATLPQNRSVKVPYYARAGIPESWLIDVENGLIEQYTDPTPDGYRHITVLRRDDTLTSKLLPLTVSVNDIL